MLRNLSSQPATHVLLIIAVSILIYSNTFHVPFQFDDRLNIIENSRLRDLGNFWPPSGSRWFGFLTFALTYQFSGLNTVGYHIVNLAVHILNAFLVYRLTILTLKTQSEGSAAAESAAVRMAALSTSLFFACHPVQTQAVTYVVQRFTSLATFFYLSSLLLYITWRMSAGRQDSRETQSRAPKIRHAALYLGAVLSSVLAMKTKEIAFTLPVMIALYEFMFFSGKTGERIVRLVPFLLTMLIIPLSLIGAETPLGDMLGELREATQETKEISRGSYLITQSRVITTYLRLLLLPINQNLDYDYPVHHSLSQGGVFPALLLLLTIIALAAFSLYRVQRPRGRVVRPQSNLRRLTVYGTFWFFVTLSVESSVIPIRDVIFEHRLYLPSVGVFLAMAPLLFSASLLPAAGWQKKGVLSALAVILAVLATTTYMRNSVWQDEVALWSDVREKSPRKARAYNNLGLAYARRERLNEAVSAYEAALRLKPDHARAHCNLGLAYAAQDRMEEAIREFKAAVDLMPDFAEAHFHLGTAQEKVNRPDEAIIAYRAAVGLKPDFAEAHFHLGTSYEKVSRPGDAITAYKAALALKPDFAEAHYNLGLAYAGQGRFDEAIREFSIVLQLTPDDPMAKRLIAFCSERKKE